MKRPFTQICRSSIGIATVILFCCGCQPRGEQRSVSEVLETAKSEYRSVSKTVLDDSVRQRVDRITTVLEEMLATQEVKTIRAKAAEASDALQSVYLDSGYTSRPALGELVNEYRMLADNYTGEFSKGQVPLLVSRSYGWLASELEGVKFALRGRETR